jgi:TonB family protein
MPAWQLGTPEPTPLPEKYRKLNLVIDFTTPAAAQPYHYPDQNPVFPDLATMSPSRSNKKTQRTTEGNAKNLIANIQKQTRYPPISLRDNQQGTVHVYFEVAENGAVENAKVLSVDGSVGRELEAEVLRVVALIPPAVAPATVAGHPVRLYYALPINFKIM